MRKIMCLVLTVICLLALAGCGGGTKNAEAPVQKQAAEKVLRVGIVLSGSEQNISWL